MHRRFFLKETAIAGTGLLLLHGCVNFTDPESIQLKYLPISKKGIQTVKSLVSAIIPATDTPGAIDLDVHLFVLKMLDDCYTQTEQEQYVNGIQAFTNYAESTNKTSFSKLDDNAMVVTIQQALKDASLQKAASYALLTTKQLTITGYTQSKYVMTELVPFKMTPGKFSGCVKI